MYDAALAGPTVVVRVRQCEIDAVVDIAGSDGKYDRDLDASLAADKGLPALLLDAVTGRYRGASVAHDCDCADFALPLAGELPSETPDAPVHTSPQVT